MLVTKEKIKDFVEGLPYAVQCLDALHAVYPSPPYGGWFDISRVGFNDQENHALVYIESSLCGGSGNFLVLEKRPGGWKIIGWEIGLLSDLRLNSPEEISLDEYTIYSVMLNAIKISSLERCTSM